MTATKPTARARRSARIGELVFRAASRIHVFLYRLTGGRFGGRMVGAPVLLLTTIGRKSGKQRTKPLMYLPDGETMVIVASKGGSPAHPQWWLNLKQHPVVQVQVGRELRRMRAEEASPAERARLWPMVTELYSGYAAYQEKTNREIPLGILRPVD